MLVHTAILSIKNNMQYLYTCSEPSIIGKFSKSSLWFAPVLLEDIRATDQQLARLWAEKKWEKAMTSYSCNISYAYTAFIKYLNSQSESIYVT